MGGIGENNYFKNIKENKIETPNSISSFLYDVLKENKIFSYNKTIIDVGAGAGNLTKEFKRFKIHAIEKNNIENHFSNRCWQDDFLLTENKYNYFLLNPSCIFCNPPWNIGKGETKEYINKIKNEFNLKSRPLLPELFLRQIFLTWANDIPVVLIVPFGFRLNQLKKSNRTDYLLSCGAEITSIISLPLDVFPNVKHQSEILIFNIPDLKSHYFISKEYYDLDEIQEQKELEFNK